MRDRLRKYRKEDQAEKRFGKDINVSTKDEAPLRKPMTETETKSVSEAKLGSDKPMAGRSSFGAAFAAARRNPEAMKAGKFTWRGKEYSTALAEEKKSAPAKPATSAKPAASKREAPKATTPKVPASPVKVGKIAAPRSIAERARGDNWALTKKGSVLADVVRRAKGGKIDGIAVRGKTKAGRK